MRLIHAKHLILERFDDESKIPPYAILSHTWGEGEVSLQDFQEKCKDGIESCDPAQHMRGFQKIVYTCNQALEDGLAYVWIDTCCIDKTSSNELGEAINSMFRWYQQARICYAYLEDITADLTGTPNSKAWVSEEQLARARWFTRGWTLQELVAPEDINFYATNWTFIGSKRDLTTTLSNITSIDANVLTTRAFDTCSVAKRMAWAAHRNTTKIEDLAYCLFGLFDVNIPLVYGEGKKAFIRLQEAILKENEDESLFAWTPSQMQDTDWRHEIPRGTSIFASHPIEFIHARNIRPMYNQTEAPNVTNRGVGVEMPIYRVNEGSLLSTKTVVITLYLVVLACNHLADPDKTMYPAVPVFIHGSDRGSSTYTRHATAPLCWIKRDELRNTDLRKIHLRTNVSDSYGPPSIRYKSSFLNLLKARPAISEPRTISLRKLIAKMSEVKHKMDKWAAMPLPFSFPKSENSVESMSFELAHAIAFLQSLL